MHSPHIPLLQRIGWVDDTIAMLERAKRLSGGSIYVIRWISGVVYARLPARFEMEATAAADLNWCLQNDTKAPDGGWSREVYFHLALLSRNQGDERRAGEYLTRSGYKNYDKEIVLTTPYALSASKGFTFAPPRIDELVPGAVFGLTGFEFTDFHFIVSQDGSQLIAIDAGTRPDSARAAYEALKTRHPNLPPLTTVFITHSHWDHIGGHRYFRELNPEVQFYASSKGAQELQLSLNVPRSRYGYFFGSEFREENIADFRPQHTIAEPTEIEIGGTRFNIIPISGGETADGIFIYLPQHRILFVGDFIMPYFGAPFTEEGSIDGLLDAIDIAVRLQPNLLRHGHEPLNRLLSSPELLSGLKRNLVWLRDETLERIRSGMTRPRIHRENLVPPFIDQYPDLQVFYLVLRENFINRLFDKNVGYWQPGGQGMDTLGAEESGRALTRYLQLSEERIASAGARMLAAGDYSIAVRLLQWGLAEYPASAALGKLRERALLKLSEKYQVLNPFKFIIYSQQISRETPVIERPPGDSAR